MSANKPIPRYLVIALHTAHAAGQSSNMMEESLKITFKRLFIQLIQQFPRSDIILSRVLVTCRRALNWWSCHIMNESD
jgi:hypothetical protein